VKAVFSLVLYCLINQNMQTGDSVKIAPDLMLVRLTGNTYMHISTAYVEGFGKASANGVIFINGKEAFLFDTPWNDTLTSTLITYLQNKMHLHIAVFIPNHWHQDCMGGLGYLKSQHIRSYANQKTIDIAKLKGLPVPDQGFTDSLQLNMGGKSIFCYFPGAAHSMDNIVVWIPSEKVLFPGCMCKSLNATNPGNTADGDTSSYPFTIDRVISKFRDAKIIVPGHGAAGGPELLTHTRSLFR
jgi:metallo-beta-lactamase class B